MGFQQVTKPEISELADATVESVSKMLETDENSINF
jgi:hypothetical protein